MGVSDTPLWREGLHGLQWQPRGKVPSASYTKASKAGTSPARTSGLPSALAQRASRVCNDTWGLRMRDNAAGSLGSGGPRGRLTPLSLRSGAPEHFPQSWGIEEDAHFFRKREPCLHSVKQVSACCTLAAAFLPRFAALCALASPCRSGQLGRRWIFRKREDRGRSRPFWVCVQGPWGTGGPCWG